MGVTRRSRVPSSQGSEKNTRLCKAFLTTDAGAPTSAAPHTRVLLLIYQRFKLGRRDQAVVKCRCLPHKSVPPSLLVHCWCTLYHAGPDFCCCCYLPHTPSFADKFANLVK